MLKMDTASASLLGRLFERPRRYDESAKRLTKDQTAARTAALVQQAQLRREIAEHNAAVDAKKEAKRNRHRVFPKLKLRADGR
jgi:hypothetical protein